MPEMGSDIDTRAREHRALALEYEPSRDTDALVHALLAIEARLEEIAYYVAQLEP